MRLRFDLYAWIPQPDVPNPIASLPGGTDRWGPGACGRLFGGDDLMTPPTFASAWTKTFRGRHAFEFGFETFGAAPTVLANPSVQPGTTTVLTAPRKSGGSACFSAQARVTGGSSAVTWNAKDKQYEVRLYGEVQDPVPAMVGKRTGGNIGGLPPGPIGRFGRDVGQKVGDSLASHATPGLYWDLNLRIQQGTQIPFLQSAQYACLLLTFDDSPRAFGPDASLGGTGNLIHGFIDASKFPSYVVYVTLADDRRSATLPIFFADASKRSLTDIVFKVGSRVRTLTW